MLFPGFKRGLRLGREKVLAGGSGFCVMNKRMLTASVLFMTQKSVGYISGLITFLASAPRSLLLFASS